MLYINVPKCKNDKHLCDLINSLNNFQHFEYLFDTLTVVARYFKSVWRI